MRQSVARALQAGLCVIASTIAACRSGEAERTSGCFQVLTEDVVGYSEPTREATVLALPAPGEVVCGQISRQGNERWIRDGDAIWINAEDVAPMGTVTPQAVMEPFLGEYVALDDTEYREWREGNLDLASVFAAPAIRINSDTLTKGIYPLGGEAPAYVLEAEADGGSLALTVAGRAVTWRRDVDYSAANLRYQVLHLVMEFEDQTLRFENRTYYRVRYVRETGAGK